MGPKILVADDDVGSRALIRTALCGFDVFEVGDGIELLELLSHENQYSLIVTDIRMGWFDGIHAAASVRTAGISAPIILLTGQTDSGVAQRAARIPDSVLIHKPFSIREFVSRVHGLLRRSMCPVC